MSLIQISENVLINTKDVSVVEFIDSKLMVTIGEKRYMVISNPTKFLETLNAEMNVDPRTKQYFGG